MDGDTAKLHLIQNSSTFLSDASSFLTNSDTSESKNFKVLPTLPLCFSPDQSTLNPTDLWNATCTTAYA